MTDPKEFCHDEIVIADVESPEPNWYRFKASVPATQVDNFVFSIAHSAKTNSQDAPVLEEVGKLLMSLCWEEFAYRSNLRVSTSPIVDTSVITPHLQAATDFVVVLEGPLTPPCNLDFLDHIYLPPVDVTVEEYLVDQEIGNQRVLLGSDLLFEYPIQRGDTLVGQLIIYSSDTNEELLNQTGSLTVPLIGDHFTFDSIVFDQGISFVLGRSDSELVGVHHCSDNLQKLFGVSSVQLVFNISSTKRCQPASIEVVLAHYQMTSDSELRSSVHSAIENRLRDAGEISREASLCNELLKFAPELTSREQSIIRQQFESSVRTQHAESKMPDEDLHVLVQKMWSDSCEDVLNAAALRKFTTLLSYELQVGYTEDDVLHEIRLKAAAEGVRPEVLRKNLVDSEQLEQVQNVAAQRALFRELLKRTKTHK